MRSRKKFLTVSVNISVWAAMEQSLGSLLDCMDLWSTKWNKKKWGHQTHSLMWYVR